jgi:hypothetical protein
MTERGDIGKLMPTVARALLGEPVREHSTPKDWRYGRKGSLSIDIERGTWFSHEEDAGGGVLDLIRRERKCSVAEALRWIKDDLGATIEPVRDTTRPPAPRANYTDLAVAMWHESIPAAGTLAERYLRGRALPCPDWLRFHPRAPFKKDDSGARRLLPCMIAPMRSLIDGRITGVHRTALTPSGQKVAKAMLGVCEGAGIWLRPVSEPDAELGVCEGIETGLALIELGWSHALLACADAGRMRRLPLLDGIARLTIFADNDLPDSDKPCPRFPDFGGEGVASARALAERYIEHGVVTGIRVPDRPGDDFHDEWVRAAAETAA